MTAGKHIYWEKNTISVADVSPHQGPRRSGDVTIRKRARDSASQASTKKDVRSGQIYHLAGKDTSR